MRNYFVDLANKYFEMNVKIKQLTTNYRSTTEALTTTIITNKIPYQAIHSYNVTDMVLNM